MAVMLKNDSIFLHIPKTGGKWVDSVLKELDLIRFNFSHNHSDYERTINFNRYYPMHFIRQTIKNGYYLPKVRAAFKFCFVRHPLKYYESYFKYAWSLDWPRFPGLNVNSNTDLWHPNEPLFEIGDKDFNKFIENVIQHCPGYVTSLYDSFVNQDIDFVGKTENLSEDLIKVLELMNIDFNEEKVKNHKMVNVSKKTNSKIIWDEDLKQEILKLEYPTLKKYGYLE